ncbi:MAG: PAS domain S-box protein, partial [bacterium]|nr:PAS domain S-box protein [bacterium]
MEQNKHKQFLYLVCIFLLMSLGISLAGGHYYVKEAQSQKERALHNLEAIADLKSNEITSWRTERIADARVLHSNPFLHKMVSGIIMPESGHEKSLMHKYLDGIAAEYGYESWIIYDSSHKLLAFSKGADHEIIHEPSWFSSHSMEEIFLSDLHIEKNGSVDMDLVIPASLEQRTYLIVFTIDPSVFLYPLIQSWPGASGSGETLLVEKNGEKILFLNDLRNRKNTAMKMRTPFLEDLPAVKAVNKIATTMEGRDYRGVPVLAATRHVEGSPWGLVAKIDVEEVLSPMKNRLAFVVLSSVLLVLASGIAIIFLWQRQRDAIKLSEAFKYKAIASELRETRDRLVEAQQISHLGNWNWDILSGSLTWSDEIYRIFGLKPRESTATYEAFMDNIHPEDRQMTIDAVDHALKDDTPYNIEHRIIRPDGSVRTVNEIGKISRDSSGAAIKMTGIVHDITERVLSNEKLLSLTAMQEAILDNAGYAIISTTPEGVITSFNKAAEQMLGYKAEELIGKETPSKFHDRDEVSMRAVQFSQELKAEIDAGFEVLVTKSRRNLPNEHEWTYIRKDGSPFPVLLSVTAMRNPEGDITGFLALAADITHLKEREQEHKSILETAMDGFWIVNGEGRIMDTNDAYCKLTGYSREEMLGIHIPDIEAAERPEETAAHMKTIIEKGKDRFETKHRCKDGSIIDVEISTNGEVVNGEKLIFCVSRDISERKQTQEALSLA